MVQKVQFWASCPDFFFNGRHKMSLQSEEKNLKFFLKFFELIVQQLLLIFVIALFFHFWQIAMQSAKNGKLRKFVLTRDHPTYPPLYFGKGASLLAQ